MSGKRRNDVVTRAAVVAVAGLLGFSASAQAGVSANGYPGSLADYSFWPGAATLPASNTGTDPVVAVSTPNSSTNPVSVTTFASAAGGGSYSVLGGSFLTPNTGFANLSAISIIAGGAGHAAADISLHLYEFNNTYTAGSGGYVPATAFVQQPGGAFDLLGSGNGVSFQFGGSPDAIREFDFTGLDQATLKPNTRYAFEIWNQSETQFFVKRVGAGATVNDNPYTEGQIYGAFGAGAQAQGSTVTRGGIAGGPRNMLMAVYSYVPTRPTAFFQTDINGGGRNQLHPNHGGWSPWGRDPAVNPGNGGQDDVLPVTGNGADPDPDGGYPTNQIVKSFAVPTAGAASGSLNLTVKSVNVAGGAYVSDDPRINSRDMGSPANNGAFTHGDIYRDYVIAEAGGTISNGTNHRMEIQVEGLDANTPYQLTFYAYDNGGVQGANVYTDVTGNPLVTIPAAQSGDGNFTPGDGTGGTQYAPAGQYSYGTAAPTTNDERAVILTATSDGTGKLVFVQTTVTGLTGLSQPLPVLNGLEIAKDARVWSGAATVNWTDAGNWATGWVANGLGHSANFGGGSPTAITVNAPVTVGRMNFSAAGNFSIGGGSTITLNDSSINSTLSGGGYSGRTEINLTSTSGGATITAPLLLAKDTQVWTQTAAQTLTLTNLQPSAVMLRKAGLGTLEVNNVRANALQVNAGAVKVLANSTAAGVSRVNDLSVAAGAKLDLGDNKLIVSDPLGTWGGSAYTGVSGLVDSGRGNASNAQWDGSGVTTSDPRAVNNNDLVSIGTASASNVKGVASTATTTFAGQTVLGSDSIAMVTWGGDANLDGKINIDDYGQIDFNVSSSGSVFGWFNGDFNYDGKINIDDYGIIDFNVTAQNSIFPTAGGAGLDGAAAVPEPSAVACLVAAATGVLARRRRARG